jgi:fatty acid-binding protein DegV
VAVRVEQMRLRVHLWATLDTVKHPHRSGRVGGPEALFGSLLQVKPILHGDSEGVVEALERRGARGKALERLRHRIATRLHGVALLVTHLTPVMGIHTGPGVVGVGFRAEG